jgi:hypothetical protein
LKNGMRIGTVIVLKSGEFRKNGVVLNHCPFCGNRIYEEK